MLNDIIIFNIVYWILKQWFNIFSNKNNNRIMIIDDDKDITNLFKMFLECNGV